MAPFQSPKEDEWRGYSQRGGFFDPISVLVFVGHGEGDDESAVLVSEEVVKRFVANHC